MELHIQGRDINPEQNERKIFAMRFPVMTAMKGETLIFPVKVKVKDTDRLLSGQQSFEQDAADPEQQTL